MSGSCRFCAIGLEKEPWSVGRPPECCSKRCRQADYRERAGIVRTTVGRAAARRRMARLEAELERNLAAIAELADWPAEGLSASEREIARAEAHDRAWRAWPAPRGDESLEDYVAAQKAAHELVDGVSSP